MARLLAVVAMLAPGGSGAQGFPNPLPVPFLSQIDPAWASDTMEESFASYAECACQHTVLSMVIQYYAHFQSGGFGSLFYSQRGSPATPPGIDRFMSEEGQIRTCPSNACHGLSTNFGALLHWQRGAISAGTDKLVPICVGFNTFVLVGAPAAIVQAARDSLESGGPVLVLIKVPRGDGTSFQHYVVAAGWDDQTQDFFVHDPLMDQQTALNGRDPASLPYTELGAPVIQPHFTLIDLYPNAEVLELVVVAPGDDSFAPYDCPPIPEKFMGCSPVELLVETPSGDRLGFDPIAQSVVQEEGTYLRDGWHDPDGPYPEVDYGSAILPSAEEGIYRFTLTGIGDGAYDLVSVQGGVLESGTIGPGEQRVVERYFSPIDGYLGDPPEPAEVFALEPKPLGPSFAVARATVDTKQSSTSLWFEWGRQPDLSDALRTTPRDVGSASPQEFSWALSPLEPNTDYYVRAAARNGSGVVKKSRIRSFRSEPAAANQVPHSFAALLDHPESSPQRCCSGYGISIQPIGENIAIGHPTQPTPGLPLTRHGAVYLHDETGAVVTTIRNPEPPPGSVGNGKFGRYLASTGKLLAVSAEGNEPGGVPGAVYLFDPDSGDLVRRILNPSFGTFPLSDGNAPLLGHGNRLFVGSGDRRVHVYNPGTGTPLFQLQNPKATHEPGGRGFGRALSAAGDLLLVGAEGLAMLFDQRDGALLLEVAPTGHPLSAPSFGASVALSGDGTRILVAADGLDHASAPGKVFVYDATSGGLLRVLQKPVPTGNDYFGHGIAVSGGQVLIGAPGRDQTNGGTGPAAFLFDVETGDLLWTFSDPDGDALDPDDHPDYRLNGIGFGRSVSLSEGVAAVGSSRRTAAYRFDTCGNGVLTAGEQCDDGNLLDGDGCSATCQIPACGDGSLDPGEQCDDGNGIDGDGCDRNCRSTGCGSGIATAGEQCDDGNASDADSCSNACTVQHFCGNRVIELGEECDDGNAANGDGCSDLCRVEPFCGDGAVDGIEACDDGNLVSGDGCSSQCEVEDICPNDPDDDADGDGLCGDVDNCPAVPNPGQADSDSDGLGNACDACPLDAQNDADGDGVCGDVDNCPAQANAGQSDSDGDGTGNACDVCPLDPDDDLDGDGVCGNVDNCPGAANASQDDHDGDGIGDVCDPDRDGDGVPNANDACPFTRTGDRTSDTGCSLDQLCECEPDPENESAYLDCLLASVGMITEDPDEADEIVAETAEACLLPEPGGLTGPAAGIALLAGLWRGRRKRSASPAAGAGVTPG